MKKYFGNELKYIKKVLNGEKWSSTEGSWNNKLEKEFCKSFNSRYAISANSGTSTLHMALYSLGIGIKKEDEVIIPSLSVIMDAASVIQCGAIPIFTDIQEDTFLIDPKDIRKKINNKTKAIIVVSLYGLMENEQELKSISNDYNIPIILDNAQHLGNHDFDITSYSFESTKHISCGEGGMVTTNNEEYARKMRLFGNHGFKNSKAEEGRTKLNINIFQDPEYKRHSIVGYNYRLSEFQAAIALAQLEKKEILLERRKKSAISYREVFQKYIDKGYFCFQKHNENHSYWTFAILINGNVHEWRNLRNKYIENGGDGIYGCWSVTYLEPAIEKYGYGVKCPISEKIQPRILQFKTNYRSEEILKEKMIILEKTLKQIYG